MHAVQAVEAVGHIVSVRPGDLRPVAIGVVVVEDVAGGLRVSRLAGLAARKIVFIG